MMKMNKKIQYIVTIAFLLAMFAGGLNNDVVFGELSGNAVGGNLVLNVQRADLIASSSSINFGEQLFRTSNPAETVMLINTSDSEVNITSIYGSSSVGMVWNTGQSFFIENDNCSGVVLASQGTCSFDIEFLPWSLGSKTGTVYFSTDASVGATELSLFGEAIPGSQLLTNRSYENYALSTGLPTRWDKNPNFNIGTDGVSTEWAFHLNHSFKLVGDGTNKVFGQTIEKSGSPGDDFSFFVTVHAQDIPSGHGRWLMQVMFYNGSTIVGNRNVPLRTGTYDTLRLTRMYTATTNYTRIVFRVHFGKDSGIAWVDLASLQWAP